MNTIDFFNKLMYKYDELYFELKNNSNKDKCSFHTIFHLETNEKIVIDTEVFIDSVGRLEIRFICIGSFIPSLEDYQIINDFNKNAKVGELAFIFDSVFENEPDHRSLNVYYFYDKTQDIDVLVDYFCDVFDNIIYNHIFKGTLKPLINKIFLQEENLVEYSKN